MTFQAEFPAGGLPEGDGCWNPDCRTADQPSPRTPPPDPDPARRIPDKRSIIDGHACHSVQEGLGPPHRAQAPEWPDAAVHRVAPDSRSHESPGLRHAAGAGLGVQYPERTVATVDHIVPTRDQRRPFGDVMAEDMLSALERNVRGRGVPLFDLRSGAQGIVHVIGPELGLTQPGMTIACGDSHTSTHGAFGAVAFGIGTSQVRDVLASQCLAMDPLKVRRISVTGRLTPGVYAKDVILEDHRRLGVNGGVGYAYEYAGDTVERMSMDERMTICNMSIEGGARVGYVNPDQTTIDYLRGKKYAPQGEEFDKAAAWWLSMASDADARTTTKS